MAYERTGGKGKSGTLRQQYNYYIRRLKSRLIEEQALKEARGAGSIQPYPETLFKKLDYNKVFTEGITRKVGNKTVRFYGTEAIEIQLAGLRQRSSKSYMAKRYIDNFIKAMSDTGFSRWDQMEARKLLSSISIDRLTILIDSGLIPSIGYVYNAMAMGEIMDRIRGAVSQAKNISSEEMKRYSQMKKDLTKNIKERMKIRENK